MVRLLNFGDKMKTKRWQVIKDIIKEQNREALFLEEQFDKALIGSALKYGRCIVAAYNTTACLKILMKYDQICEIEAYEKFKNSIESKEKEGNYPVFINDFRKIKLIDLENLDLTLTINKMLGTNGPF
jgi:hypothetical protein